MKKAINILLIFGLLVVYSCGDENNDSEPEPNTTNQTDDEDNNEGSSDNSGNSGGSGNSTSRYKATVSAGCHYFSIYLDFNGNTNYQPEYKYYSVDLDCDYQSETAAKAKVDEFIQLWENFCDGNDERSGDGNLTDISYDIKECN